MVGVVLEIGIEVVGNGAGADVVVVGAEERGYARKNLHPGLMSFVLCLLRSGFARWWIPPSWVLAVRVSVVVGVDIAIATAIGRGQKGVGRLCLLVRGLHWGEFDRRILER